MPLQWPVDKATLINSALVTTGDNLVAVADDGSDEWNVCSATYERALGIMLEDYNWGSVTKVATLVASPTPPADNAWDTAYPIPQDLLHLIWVRITRDSEDSNAVGTSTLYDILNNQIVLNAQGGPPPPSPPQTPAIITIKYVSLDNSDLQVAGTPLFVSALQSFVMSGIYRGLHEDNAEADKMWRAGEMFAQRARSRYDQQKPKRQFWNSRIGASRRVRRPWPQTGNDNWGGSGTPS